MTQPFVTRDAVAAAPEALDTVDLAPDIPSSFDPTSPLADGSITGRLASTRGSDDDEVAVTGPMPATPPAARPSVAAVEAEPAAPTDSSFSAAFAEIGSTIPFASPTTASASTAPITPAAADEPGATTPIAPPTNELVLDELDAGDEVAAELRAKLKVDPTDVDALGKLAVRLHRMGRPVEARATIARLALVYEQRGQPAQALRIRQMLGDTGEGPPPPTATRSQPAAGPASSPTAGFAAAQTVKLPTAPTAHLEGTGGRATSPLGLTARLRQTGAMAGGSALLRRTASLDAAGEPEATIVAPFPPTALTFTIPLPGEDDLPAEVRAVVAESGRNLSDGRLAAALDACLHALSLDDGYLPLSIRVAEIYTVRRHARRARAHADTLLRLMDASGQTDHRWMAYRILLHTADRDLASLRSLVELLIETGRTEQASYYAARLIRLLDGEGLADEALAYSARLCELIPGDTRAALENAVLRLEASDPGGAVDRWEAAVAAGADPIIARASLAAVMTAIDEDDHWRMLAEVAPRVLADREAGAAIVDAYARTAEVMAPSPALRSGRGLLLHALGDPTAGELLADVAGDRTASPMARAVAAVTLARLHGAGGAPNERGAALRTALALLADPAIANHPAWLGLNGSIPRFEDLSLELGELLLDGQDPIGAVEALKAAHQRSPHHDQLCLRLADAYFRTGQLGAALTVLDGLAGHYRAGGQLEPMAAVLRRMSQMAPNNIKVKSRLIDTYLQRGFVAEARAELIQRADLEERSGLIKDAVASLQRAADLSWTVGMAEETFALYKRILALAPEQVDCRHALVTLYLQMGRLAEAAEQQRAIVDISLHADRKHEAIAALHQVIGLTPDDTSAYYQLGELLSAAGEYGQAERVYRRIMAITPDDAIAQAKANSMAALRERRTA